APSSDVDETFRQLQQVRVIWHRGRRRTPTGTLSRMATVGTRLTQLGLNRTEPFRRTSRLAVHQCRVGFGLTPLDIRRRLRLISFRGVGSSSSRDACGVWGAAGPCGS
ncbi:hypothetical protein PC110_g23144, partial [Phytophthora cactorum]